MVVRKQRVNLVGQGAVPAVSLDLDPKRRAQLPDEDGVQSRSQARHLVQEPGDVAPGLCGELGVLAAALEALLLGLQDRVVRAPLGASVTPQPVELVRGIFLCWYD